MCSYCWWVVVYREDGVGDNSSGFFDCFVGQFITWNVRITRDPLNENERRNRVSGIMNERGTRIL